MSDHIHKKGDTLIERYEIEHFLGEGGMQQVYVAKDLSLKRKVALKVPIDTAAKKRFARSARVSAKISHANLAKTLDYFKNNDREYLIEEFIVGTDLQKRLDAEFYCFDPHLAAHLIHHLVKGLSVCQHAAIVHRDLKPSNIMVSQDAGLTVVKITDFGIAKMAEAELEEGIEDAKGSTTTSSTVLGALPYMAPEVIQMFKEAGLPADIWSVGAILYRLVSGAPPFGTGLPAVPKILAAVLPPKPPLFQKPQFVELANGLWDIIESCLQSDPALRPDADELLETCSRLCYSDAERHFGTIESFKFYGGKGKFGFIETEKGDTVNFHIDSYYGPAPSVGTQVNFACFPGVPRNRAFPVLPLRAA